MAAATLASPLPSSVYAPIVTSSAALSLSHPRTAPALPPPRQSDTMASPNPALGVSACPATPPVAFRLHSKLGLWHQSVVAADMAATEGAATEAIAAPTLAAPTSRTARGAAAKTASGTPPILIQRSRSIPVLPAATRLGQPTLLRVLPAPSKATAPGPAALQHRSGPPSRIFDRRGAKSRPHASGSVPSVPAQTRAPAAAALRLARNHATSGRSHCRPHASRPA